MAADRPLITGLQQTGLPYGGGWESWSRWKLRQHFPFLFKPTQRRLKLILGGKEGQRYRLAKRALDLALCWVSFPFAGPVLLLIAIAIRLDSSGPILFVQERVGRGGRHFQMFKFRTMRHDYNGQSDREFMKAYIAGQVGADNESLHKPMSTTQITRVGRILRRTSLDELPQLFNVLRGEMSLVGPRPHVPWEVEAYNIWHTERLEVLPGITGLAQVQGRSNLSFKSSTKYDIEYVRNRCLKLDLQVLGLTVRSVLSGRGAG